MHEQNIKALEELRRLIQPERCIAFIGSGPSTGRGLFDDWRTLIEKLCKKCGLDSHPSDYPRARELQMLADEARSANEEAYHSYLGTHFGRTDQTNTLYRTLMRIPFRSYVTLNFDPLLKYEADMLQPPCPTHGYPRLDRVDVAHRSVFYLHGLIREGATPTRGSIVLGLSDFDEAYRNNGPILSFLVQTFAYDQIVFIGCRLREEVFETVFTSRTNVQDQVRSLSRGKPPNQIVLLPQRADDRCSEEKQRKAKREETNENAFYEAYGVSVIRYNKLNERHTGLRKLFERWAGIAPADNRFDLDQGEA